MYGTTLENVRSTSDGSFGGLQCFVYFCLTAALCLFFPPHLSFPDSLATPTNIIFVCRVNIDHFLILKLLFIIVG